MERMIGYTIETIEGAGESIVIREDETRIRLVPLAAIASWSELLGYEDPEDALDAILHVQDNGEPAPDPVTGETVWTPLYQARGEVAQVEGRQRVAERMAARAAKGGVQPTAQVSRPALPDPAQAARDKLVSAQDRARRALGAPAPRARALEKAQTGAAGPASPTGAANAADPMSQLRARLHDDLAPKIGTERARFARTFDPTSS